MLLHAWDHRWHAAKCFRSGEGTRPSYPADDSYLRKFIIYMISSVFAPTTGIKVSPKCYPPVINVEAIKTLNWPRFIIDTLIQTARAKDKKNWFKACMPYLMVRVPN
jgi:hypothetical protein